MTSRNSLRTTVRQRRQQLSRECQQQAALQLIEQFQQVPELVTSQHIALYLTNDGELDTQPLIHWLWQQQKQLYLPVLHPIVAGYLLFVRYQPDTVLHPNRFGIAEPLAECHNIIPVQQLDMVCTPLVAFDNAGNRLGMGGGFYDRTLSQLTAPHKVAIIGLAHDCQQVEAVPVDAWDIPLPRIVSPSRQWAFNR